MQRVLQYVWPCIFQWPDALACKRHSQDEADRRISPTNNLGLGALARRTIYKQPTGVLVCRVAPNVKVVITKQEDEQIRYGCPSVSQELPIIF